MYILYTQTWYKYMNWEGGLLHCRQLLPVPTRKYLISH